VLLAFVRWGKEHIPGTQALNQGPAHAGPAELAPSTRRKRTRGAR